MRLYLSSFRIGNHPARLQGLVDGTQAAVVFNAADAYEAAERAERLSHELASLSALGFEAEELDLRDYFQQGEERLATRMAQLDLVWVRGGNPFILRRAMAQSGFDRILVDLLEQDALVYGGYSAGVAVLTPSLRGTEIVDDPFAIPPGYEPPVIWDGLALLPYAVAPHYRSDHPETFAIEQMVQYFIDNRILFKAMRDGEVMVLDGAREEFLVKGSC